MRRRRPDMQRTAGRSMWRFREGCCIFTYCSSEAVLYSEKSSCLLPWCAQCRLSGRWWTVSLWTTGSPLHSVSASRFRYSSLQLSGLCKREAALPFIVTSLKPAEHAGCFLGGGSLCVLGLSIQMHLQICKNYYFLPYGGHLNEAVGPFKWSPFKLIYQT